MAPQTPEQPILPTGPDQVTPPNLPYEDALKAYGEALSLHLLEIGGSTPTDAFRQAWLGLLMSTASEAEDGRPTPKPDITQPTTTTDSLATYRSPGNDPIEAGNSKLLKFLIAAQATGVIAAGSLFGLGVKNTNDGDPSDTHHLDGIVGISQVIDTMHDQPDPTKHQVRVFEAISTEHPECDSYIDHAAQLMGVFNEKPPKNTTDLINTTQTAIEDYKKAKAATDYLPLPNSFYKFAKDITKNKNSKYSFNQYEKALAKYAKELGVPVVFDWDINSNIDNIPSDSNYPLTNIQKNTVEYKKSLLNIWQALANTPKEIVKHANVGGIFVTNNQNVSILGQTKNTYSNKPIISVSGMLDFPESIKTTLPHEYTHGLVFAAYDTPIEPAMTCLNEIIGHLNPFKYWSDSNRQTWMPKKGYTSLENSEVPTTNKIATSSDYGGTDKEEDTAENYAIMSGWNDNLSLLYGKNSNNTEVLKQKLATTIQIIGQIDRNYATEKIAQLRLVMLEAALRRASAQNPNNKTIRTTLDNIKKLKRNS